MYAGGPSSPACATRCRPSSRQRANTRANFSGGLPRSPLSSPTPMNLSRNGSACSSVANAASSDRWRRKHRISDASMPYAGFACAQARASPLTTVANSTPRAVCVCGSKNSSACTTLSAAARAKYAMRQLVEVVLADQHAGARVVDVEEALQVGERVRRAQRRDGGMRERDAVAPREPEDELGLERALDVDVQLRLRHRLQQRGQALAARSRRDSSAGRSGVMDVRREHDKHSVVPAKAGTQRLSSDATGSPPSRGRRASFAVAVDHVVEGR